MAGPTASDRARDAQRLKLLGTPLRTGTPSLTGLTPAQSSPVSSYSDPDEISFYGIGSGLSVDELAMLQQAGESPQNIARLAQMNQARMLQQARQHTFDPTLGQIVRDTATPEGAMGAVNGALFRLPEALYGAVQSPEGKQQMKEWMYQNPGFGYGSNVGDAATMLIPAGALARGAGVGFNALRLKDLAQGMYGLEAAAKGSHLGKAMLAQTLEQMAPRAAANALEGKDQTATVAGASLAALPFLGRGGVVVSDKVFPMASDVMDQVMASKALQQRLLESSPKTLNPSVARFNPDAVAQREQLMLEGYKAGGERVGPMAPRQMIDPKSLIGRTIVPIFADRTMTNWRLRDLNGLPLTSPVISQGGIDYPLAHLPLGTGNGFASTELAAGNGFKRAEGVSKPIFMSVAGEDATSNFATPSAEIIAKALPSITRMSPDAIQAADDIVRSKYPTWPGILDPSAMKMIKGEGPQGKAGAGALRKQIVKAWGSKEMEYAGALPMNDIYSAVNDPSIPFTGASGQAFLNPVKGAILNTNSLHDSYTHGMPMDYVGGLSHQLPLEVAMPDVVKYSQGQKEGWQRAIQTNVYDPNYNQVVTPQLVESWNRYLSSMQPR